MTFKYRYRKQIIIGIIIFLIIISSSTLLFFKFSDKKSEKDILVENKKEETLEKKDSEKEENQEEQLLKVDIKGEIVTPGIYSLIASSRVIDVIQLAGGLTENADTSVINLSKKIKDEMVIIIYSRDQVQNFKETKEQEKYLNEKCHENDETGLKNDACLTEEEQIPSKVNINTATKEELMTLNGIGESKAQDIIAYRETNGTFNSIEEIQNVQGIGESLYAKIKENITT